LVELAGIAFKTADKLAMSLGLPAVSPERVDEALMYGKTLGDILTMEPRAINWLATKFSGDETIKAAAEFICAYSIRKRCISNSGSILRLTFIILKYNGGAHSTRCGLQKYFLIIFRN
ncbi:MAG: hypothetical protein IKU07_06995, partial [Oscillospiraceae bacterium]|nr:hypothetical protein [Oscillospiraceae bacterium]